MHNLLNMASNCSSVKIMDSNSSESGKSSSSDSFATETPIYVPDFCVENLSDCVEEEVNEFLPPKSQTE